MSYSEVLSLPDTAIRIEQCKGGVLILPSSRDRLHHLFVTDETAKKLQSWLDNFGGGTFKVESGSLSVEPGNSQVLLTLTTLQGHPFSFVLTIPEYVGIAGGIREVLLRT